MRNIKNTYYWSGSKSVQPLEKALWKLLREAKQDEISTKDEMVRKSDEQIHLFCLKI